MKKYFIICSIALALILSGCYTKRQYFEPEKIDSDISYSGNIGASIIYSSFAGATLSNGKIITKGGIDNDSFNIDKNYKMLAYSNNKVVIANLNGNLKIRNKAGVSLFEYNFPQAVVSANLEENLLAAITADNNLYLIDIENSNILMQYASKEVYAIDSRVANPYFLGSLIIYPSLDGKIYIVNKTTSSIIKDVTISSDEFFNNVIYLGVVGDTMIAATAKRVISVSPDKTVYYDGEIKSVLINNSDIYIFKKDGSFLRTNLDLIEKDKAYLKFAIFSDAIVHNNNLYIIEKTGYLIKTDLNLSNISIQSIPSAVEDNAYLTPDVLYYGSSYIKLR